MARRLYAHSGWILPLGLLVGVLGLWGTVGAQNQGAPGAGRPPFANAVDQRDEMIRELREMRSLLKEQNALLRQLVENTDAAPKSKR